MEKENCIFCKIINGELPSKKVHEDDMSIAFLDISPVHIGHTLVIPKKHFENIYNMPDDTASHLIKIAKRIANALKKSGADGINITINNDKDAGQVIFHSHIHIIPRFKGDNIPMWPNKKPKEEEMTEIAEKITSALKDLR